MKKIWEHLVRYIRQKQFYYRLLFFYTIMGIVIISIVTGISFSLLGKRYEQEIRTSNRHVLGQIVYFTDQNLYGTVVQMINDYILTDYFDVGISRFYSPGISFTNYDCYKYYQTIAGLMTKNDFIHSITLYRRTPGYVVDSRYGLGVEPEMHPENLDRVFPFSGYCGLAAGESRIQIAAPEELAFVDGDWPYLTILRRIPLYTTAEDALGYFAVSLEQEYLWKKLQENYQYQGVLFILDEKGNLILDNMPEGERRRNIEKNFDESFFQDGNTSNEIEVDGIKYDVTTMVSTESGWHYISVLPMKTLVADSIAANRMVLLIAALLAVMSFLTVKFISGKLYKPLNVLRRHAVKNGSVPEARDDISAINDVLSFFEEKVDDMEKTISQNAQVLIYKSMMDILYKNNRTEEEIYRQLMAAGVSVGGPFYLYCILVTEIDSSVFFSLSLEQQEYIAARLRGYMEEWLKEPVLQATEFQKEGKIITLLSLQESMYLNLLEGRAAILQELQARLHVSVNIVISDAVQKLAELSGLFTESVEYLSYRYLYGFGNIFLQEELRRQNGNHYSLEAKAYYEFEANLRTSRFEEADRMLEMWEEEIRKGCFSEKSVCNFVVQIYNLCVRMEKERGLLKEDELLVNVFVGFDTAADFGEAAGSLHTWLLLCREAAANKNGDSHMVREVMAHVKQNCEAELTLTSIAQKFAISPAHLSRTFKGAAGCNLSVFIVNCKLAKAADYLAENPELTTAQVAEKFGYYTPAYFTRLFKAKYGVTPYQYQKMHRAEEKMDTGRDTQVCRDMEIQENEEKKRGE